MADPLPIKAVLPELIAALKAKGHAVLQAPPGAGKTTMVPLALDRARLTPGRIVMLEPRRLAARTAAARMADLLEEPLGQSVGYRIRGDTRVSKSTRIEVVTEGILTRMIQSDPALDGIGVVIFDEFHERSLNGDLGLALALEARAALREDLILLVMSATLDAEPVARLLGNAPLVTSAGQTFAVETHWLGKPAKGRFHTEMAALIQAVARETTGGILAFLPGEGEIRRVMAQLDLPDASILPLFGALPFRQQQAALAPTPGRKLVLATSIAETSLTIPDIRVVIDGGLARRARFDPGSGMSRLVTERASRAEADQRRGRAGRVAEGQCFRLWTRGEEGAMAPFPPAEIETADLADLALELAEWGSDDVPFLTPPPPGPMREARALLEALGALEKGSITDHGRQLARLPLHPRLGHMLEVAGRAAAPLAALLSDRDPLRGAGADLTLRLDALRSTRRCPALDRLRAEAKRLTKSAPVTKTHDAGEQAALAYPDRIALRRPGDDPRWILSGGKGAWMDPGDPLAGERLLVVTDTDGHPTEARIRSALAISEASLRDLFKARITRHRTALWDRRKARVETLDEDRLGAIVLASRRWKDAPKPEIARAMLDGVRQLGLSLSPAAERLCARVALARNAGHDLPSMTNDDLMARLEDWLLPHLGGTRSASEWKAFDACPALTAMLDWPARQRLDQIAPPDFTTPLGRKIDISYQDGTPRIAVRLQEMFGVTSHPSVAGKPLSVTLLSPANRPLQTTMDLPGFWASSYSDVRKDMRGRYPKHPWPEDPTVALPTLRTKRKSG